MAKRRQPVKFNEKVKFATIDAEFKDGKLFLFGTNTEIEFHEKNTFQIKILVSQLKGEVFKMQFQERVTTLARSGDILYFYFNGIGGRNDFKIELQDDLSFIPKGTNFSRLSKSKCIVTERAIKEDGQGFQPIDVIEADSINQAYNLAAKKYMQESKSTAFNAFDRVTYEGKKLSDWERFFST
jgi:hypothetical protein